MLFICYSYDINLIKSVQNYNKFLIYARGRVKKVKFVGEIMVGRAVFELDSDAMDKEKGPLKCGMRRRRTPTGNRK